MKCTLRRSLLWVAAILVLFVTSCSDDVSPSYDDLSGTWYGTRYYMNNGTVKYQYITLVLNSDGTGSMEYESPVSFSAANFTWSVNGNKLVCRGAYANTYGEMSGSYLLECKIENGRLLPIGQFSSFILTKDNSVMTDGDGKEVANPEEQLYMLQNVWVSEDRTTVVEFFPGKSYDEYVLSSPGAKYYTEFNTGDYSFNPFSKRLTMNSINWDVLTLNKEKLVLQNGSKLIKYNIGTRDDIPSQVNLKKYLTSATWGDDKGKYMFVFKDDGSVIYLEDSGRRYGSYGSIVLRAEGNYNVSGSSVTCRFTDVSWEYGASGTSNWFPGWTYGKSCTKTYKIVVSPSTSLQVTFPDSKVVYLDKL